MPVDHQSVYDCPINWKSTPKVTRGKAHPLCVDLVDVGKSLGENVARHLVAVLVSEFGRFAASTVNAGSGIGYGAGHDAADGGRQSEDMRNGGRIDQFVLEFFLESVTDQGAKAGGLGLTATFFCDSTTAQSFPLTPSEVMFAEVMALNAYSRCQRVYRVSQSSWHPPRPHSERIEHRQGRHCGEEHTDLVQTSIVREDGDMSVVTCASCSRMIVSSSMKSWAAGKSMTLPDMTAADWSTQ